MREEYSKTSFTGVSLSRWRNHYQNCQSNLQPVIIESSNLLNLKQPNRVIKLIVAARAKNPQIVIRTIILKDIHYLLIINR